MLSIRDLQQTKSLWSKALATAEKRNVKEWKLESIRTLISDIDTSINQRRLGSELAQSIERSAP
jgi:hypothetical protein